jgi:molybdenum cofactor biosynthesis enzyme
MKDINDLFKENYKPLKKEIKEEREDGKVSHAHGLVAIYMFNKISIKIPMTFIIEIQKSTIKFIWKHKTLQIPKANTEQKEQYWRYHNT